MWKQANLDQTLPEKPSEEEKKEEVEEKKSDGMTLYPEVLEELSKLLNAEDYKSLVEYIDGLKNGSIAKDKWLVLTEEFSEKERRAAIHTFFKEKVKLYETDTILFKLSFFYVTCIPNK